MDAEEVYGLPEPQRIEILATIVIEIYWPHGDSNCGIVYVNEYCAHSLSFQRIVPEDTVFGDAGGLWKLENRYFRDDDSLVEAIKNEACKGILSGKMRLHFDDRR